MKKNIYCGAKKRKKRKPTKDCGYAVVKVQATVSCGKPPCRKSKRKKWSA